MATESGAVPTGSGQQGHQGVMDKGLKKGAIGYISNIVIGVASTAPAYSLAATLGFIVAVKGVGVHAPAVLLVSFIPMLLIASAYKYLNRADPDAGTTFAWTTRALGPGTGWVNGWAIFLADVIVMASLADIAAIYTFKLFGFTELGESNAAIIIVAVLWIAIMTWICYRGIELSARIQQVLLGAEVTILGLFAVVALVKVYGGSPPHGSIKPTADWFNPFAMNFHDLVVAVLLGVFIYWGWDSGVAVNEESDDPANGPGKAAVISTILLVFIYLIVSAGAQSFHGVGFLTAEANQEDVLNALGSGVLGSTLNKLLIIAVLTSASASTQTTILPTARTTLSMAHWKAVTKVLSRVHKQLPHADRLHAWLRRALDHRHDRAAAAFRKRARRLAHRDRLPDLLLLRLHRGRLRRLLPARAAQERSQLLPARRRAAARGADAVRRRHLRSHVLLEGRKRRILADPWHHAADLDGHRRPARRHRTDALLAPLLQRILRPQDRNRAARDPRRAALARAAGAGRLLGGRSAAGRRGKPFDRGDRIHTGLNLGKACSLGLGEHRLDVDFASASSVARRLADQRKLVLEVAA